MILNDELANGYSEIITLDMNKNLLEEAVERKISPYVVAGDIVVNNEDIIKAKFNRNEYIKINVMTGEIVGFKSGDNESEPVLEYLIRKRRSIKESFLFMRLGTIDSIYENLKNRELSSSKQYMES